MIYTQNNCFDAGEILLQPNQNASVGIRITAPLGYKLYVGDQAYFAGQTYYDGGTILGNNVTTRSDMQFGMLMELMQAINEQQMNFYISSNWRFS